MATTWIKALHRSGGSVAAALELRVDYAKDADKTEDGELVEGYECDPFTAQSEFLFSKRLYEQRTGRDQGRHDVIAYHIRMSFGHGEVTAQEALELGRELALRWTKGRHQFIVAAHTNTQNPHCHIVYNSTNLESTGKFQDFPHSAIALRKLSDRICLEHGLSVIEKPGLSKGYNRSEYLGENKAPTVRDQLRDFMDAALSAGKDFDGFLAALVASGVEIKRGKQLAFKLPGGKKFIRQDTLGDDYSAEAIFERISGKRIVTPKQKNAAPVRDERKPNMLIDIQEKLRQGKSAGYAHWATGFNLQQMAKTLIYLQENNLLGYNDLATKTSAVTAEYNDRLTKINAIDKQLGEISELQKHIGNYSKYRKVYAQYKASGWNENFFETHRTALTLHKAAKNYFDDHSYGKNKKLPSMQSLRQEYAALLAEKKKLYSGWSELKEQRKELLTAKNNVDRILGIDKNTLENNTPHDKKRNQSHDR